MTDHRSLFSTCTCGQVRLEATGRPIVTVTCYCASCQAAGQKFAALPGATSVLREDGGTDFILFRKDRVSCLAGKEVLREHRLTTASKTRRVTATCCNSAMFLEFTNGHWLSLYSARVPSKDRPALEMRTMTSDRRTGVELDDTVPSSKTQSVKFMARLLAAWVAMGFRAPRIDFV